MVALLLQVIQVLLGLSMSWLLAKKHYEKYGWLLGIFCVFFWVVEEAYFRQWFLFSLNPIYFWLYIKGYLNHKDDSWLRR
jgi:hypothetical protein